MTSEETAELTALCRQWLRISTISADDELLQTAQAAMLDLKNAGVVVISTADALTLQAIKFYVKSHFGYDEKAEMYARQYEHLKAALALSSAYNTEV